MSTATQSRMATPNNQRIPLHVIHGNNQATTDDAYDLRGLGDETERIKIRMKEFEDRCKRWREEFFVKSHDQIEPQPTPFTTTDFNNNQSGSSGPPFSSSLHKSYVEDTESGGKVYKIEFDIGDFQQNELQISTKGKGLVIKGGREVKAGSSTETKTFNRELTVPDYVDLEAMTAFLLDKKATRSDKSLLVLEAPILMDKYAYRRSTFDRSQPQSQVHSPSRPVSTKPFQQNFFPSPVHSASQVPNFAVNQHNMRNQVVPGNLYYFNRIYF